jgi:IS5 family transposase
VRNWRVSRRLVSWRHVAQPLQPDGSLRAVPQLGLRFEPQLEQLDRLLDDDELFERVREDLASRYPRTGSRGRPSTPVEVILWMLVVMRLYGGSYEQAEYFVNDSLVLRQFCRVYLEKVPDDTTSIRWANIIGPETIRALNDRVVQLARSLNVTRGRKLRVDTTAVETDIHFPTDSGLLGDGVRVVSRLLWRDKAVLGDAALEAAYGWLIATVKRTAAQGKGVLTATRKRADGPKARRLAERLAEILPRLKRGIRQAEPRFLQDAPVPAGE